EMAKREFKLLPVIIFSAIFPIVIGILLRVPKLIIEMKENRKWTFDWVRFVAIALPAFFIITIPILPYSSYFITNIILIGDPTITVIAGVVFGYVLLSCVKRQNNNR